MARRPNIAEPVTGIHRLEIIRPLIDRATLVSVRVPGRNYQQLTVITAIQSGNKGDFLVMDYPKQLQQSIAGLPEWTLQLSFKGDDGIACQFTASDCRIDGNELIIGMPESIQRIQQRSTFRTEVPLGSKLLITANQVDHEMSVVNISQGGVLFALRKGGDIRENLVKGQEVDNVKLLFNLKSAVELIRVKKAKILRVEKISGGTRWRYAIRFTRMSPDQESLLKSVIYQIQGELLRKRSGIA